MNMPSRSATLLTLGLLLVMSQAAHAQPTESGSGVTQES